MPAVKLHPRVELTGTDGAWGLKLTDPEGNDLMTSVDSYVTLMDVQVASRLLEDSILYAVPLPAVLTQVDP